MSGEDEVQEMSESQEDTPEAVEEGAAEPAAELTAAEYWEALKSRVGNCAFHIGDKGVAAIDAAFAPEPPPES